MDRMETIAPAAVRETPGFQADNAKVVSLGQGERSVSTSWTNLRAFPSAFVLLRARGWFGTATATSSTPPTWIRSSSGNPT
jgi:hypothetical protein